jgi:signal recognition particle receptor subunit beta
MDFGRITLDAGLILHLFGTRASAGSGSCGTTDLPFIMAINGFDGDFPHEVADVRDALSVSARVPVVECDARERNSTAATLTALVEHAMVGNQTGW